MGNGGSQVWDDNPRYNYHESILRDAQTGLTSLETAQRISDTEQYLSAEESGNSSSEPERNRLGSSSDENLSFDSAGNDENIENNVGDSGGNIESGIRNEEFEQNALSPEVGLCRPDATSTQTSLNLDRNSVSSLQLSEGISSELVDTSERSKHICSDPGSRIGSDTGTSNRDGPASWLLQHQTRNSSNSCQTTSTHSQTSGDSERNELSLRNMEHVHNLGKRKISQDSQTDSQLPRKRMTRSSYRQKRLGYTDSSESDMGKKEDSWKPSKKRRVILQSSKKAHRAGYDSRDKDSDEDRFGKRRRIRQPRHNHSDETEESDDETEDQVNTKKYKGQRNSSSSKKRGKYSCDDSSDNSDESLKFQKRKWYGRHWTRETGSEEKEKVIYRKSLKHVSIQTVDKYANEDNEKNLQQTNLSEPEDTHNMIELGTLSSRIINAASNISSLPCHTFKMGNQSLRNSLGKVFPLRSQGHKTVEASSSNNYFSYSPKNNVGDFKAPYSESKNLPLKVSQVRHIENESLNNLSLQFIEPSPSESKEHKLETASGDRVSEHECASPFKNVVLTPSSANSSLLHGSTLLKTTPEYNTEEQCSDMEIEESAVCLETQTADGHFLSNMQPKTRSLHPGRARKRTVAARLSHFLSEKKKNIGQNLKLLFSKVNSSPSEPQNNIHPSWQTFPSPSNGQPNILPQFNNSYNTQGDSSNTFSRMSNRTDWREQLSLLNQAVPMQQQPETQVAFLTTTQPFKKNTNSSSSHVGVLFGGVAVSTLGKHGETSTQEIPQVFGEVSNNVAWLPHTIQYQILNCRLADYLEMSVIIGELTNQKTSGIVNWTDGALSHKVTSCSKSIASKAGVLMRAACDEYIESKGSNLEAPDVLTTPAGGGLERAVEAILHVVEPNITDGDELHKSHALVEVFANCLRFANERLGLDSISFPLIGEGHFPFDTCVRSFFDAVLVFLAEQPKLCELSCIQLIIPDRAAANSAANLIKTFLKQVSHYGLESEIKRTFSQYFNYKPFNKAVGPSDSSPEPHFTVERASSGRPKLKRRRL